MTRILKGSSRELCAKKPSMAKLTTAKQLLSDFQALFHVCDSDGEIEHASSACHHAMMVGSGELDREETAVLFRGLYAKTGRSRPAKAVQREVDRAMEKHDTSKDGTLNFEECCHLLCDEVTFRRRVVTSVVDKLAYWCRFT